MDTALAELQSESKELEGLGRALKAIGYTDEEAKEHLDELTAIIGSRVLKYAESVKDSLQVGTNSVDSSDVVEQTFASDLTEIIEQTVVLFVNELKTSLSEDQLHAFNLALSES